MRSRNFATCVHVQNVGLWSRLLTVSWVSAPMTTRVIIYWSTAEVVSAEIITHECLYGRLCARSVEDSKVDNVNGNVLRLFFFGSMCSFISRFSDSRSRYVLCYNWSRVLAGFPIGKWSGVVGTFPDAY